MKRIVILCLLLSFWAVSVRAQLKEVIFENGSFSEALAKARKENKLVFLDTYTSWCSACKWMDRTTFKEERVADFFNTHFVNVKVDTEKGEGAEIKKRYPGIISYPTYFILDAEGRELHRIAGGGLPDEFIERVKQGMNPETCQSTLKQRYAEGERSREFVILYLNALRTADRHQIADHVAVQYCRELGKQVSDTSNWFLFRDYIRDDVFSPGFGILLDQKDEFIRHNGSKMVNAKIDAAFMQSAQDLFWGKYDPDSWHALKKMLKDHPMANYPTVSLILDLAKAKQEEDTKKLVRLAGHELIIASLGPREKFSLFENVQQFVLEKGNAKEKTKLKKALVSLISLLEEGQGKLYFESLLDNMN